MATVTGGITPVYAAPETFDGMVSRFCDQYSLAIVYQELLTGQRPFDGSSVQQLIMQHLTAQPEPGAAAASRPHGHRQGLAKKPEDRFSTCPEMVRALRNAGMPRSAGRRGRGGTPPAAPRRRRRPRPRDRRRRRTGPSRPDPRSTRRSRPSRRKRSPRSGPSPSPSSAPNRAARADRAAARRAAGGHRRRAAVPHRDRRLGSEGAGGAAPAPRNAA